MDYINNLNFFACRQFAQRSRVRKLHYIAELEQNVQALEVGIARIFRGSWYKNLSEPEEGIVL